MSEAPLTTPEERRVCPRCGTRTASGASRCVVCGVDLKPSSGQPAGGGRELSLPWPLAVGLLVVFALLSSGATFMAVRMIGLGVAEPEPTATATTTITPTATNTPPPTETPTPQSSPTPLTHVVGPNDTCLAIAALYSVSVQSIIQLNQLPATCPLSVNQELLVPHPTATPSPEPTPTLLPEDATRQACQTIEYTVEANDTLFGIAQNYNVDLASIREWNAIAGDTVFEGQVLIIPLCERLSLGGPTPTPTVPPPYPAPNLLLPQDGEAFSLSDDMVSLQWASVGELRENEYYHVVVLDVTEGSGTRRIDAYVKDTKYLVPTNFRPNESRPHVMRWWIETVRQTGSNARGEPIYASAGSASSKRDFTWSGSAGAGGPTATP